MKLGKKNFQLLEAVLRNQLREHPLPWKVERDWSYEVVATDKTIIAKCMSYDEAERVVMFAKELYKKQATSVFQRSGSISL